MGSYSILSASSSKVSNFRSLLESLTPNVPLRPVPVGCIFDKELNPSQLPITEFFFLKDIWGSLEECSAYGRGTLVKLPNGEGVIQYFTPHLSAIHLTRIERIDQEKGCLSDSSFKFYDTKKQFDKPPLFSEMQELAKIYPELMALRSIDLSPASWMAIVWSPIYHIPNDGAEVKDFSASFITYHKLSSFRQDDDSVDSTRNGTEGTPTPLHPFALATKNLQGDVWFNHESDKDMCEDLKKAAFNWVHERKFFHHDLNEYSLLEHSRRQVYRT